MSETMDSTLNRLDGHSESIHSIKSTQDHHRERLDNVHDQQTELRKEMDDRFDKTDRKFDNLGNKISDGNEKIYALIRGMSEQASNNKQTDWNRIWAAAAVVFMVAAAAYSATVTPLYDRIVGQKEDITKLERLVEANRHEDIENLKETLAALANHDKRIALTYQNLENHKQTTEEHMLGLRRDVESNARKINRTPQRD